MLNLTLSPTDVYTPSGDPAEIDLAKVVALHSEIADYLALLTAQDGAGDTTAGRLLSVGAFGSGGLAIDLPVSNDLNDAQLGADTRFDPTALNHPAGGVGSGVVRTMARLAGVVSQVAYLVESAPRGAVVYTRVFVVSQWSDWVCLTPRATPDWSAPVARPVTEERVKSYVAGQAAYGALAQYDITAAASQVITWSGSYASILLHCSNIVPTINAEKLALRLSSDGGATFPATAGDYDGFQETNAGGTVLTDQILLADAVGNGAGNPGWSGTVEIFSPSAVLKTMVRASGVVGHSDGRVYTTTTAGMREAAEAVDAVELKFPGGIASGVVSVYGLAAPV